MDKNLRIIAALIITESELNKEAKLQLLNFVQREATDTQVKALLLDGAIINKVDEQTKQIIDERFKNHPLHDELLQEGVAELLGWFTKALDAIRNQIAGWAPGAWLSKLPGLMSSAASKGAAFAVSTPGQALGGGLAAILILMLARKAWKAYGSKAAVACAKAPDKKACMRNFQAKMNRQKIQELQRAKGMMCKQSRDPAKCAAKIDATIVKLQQKRF